MDAMRDEVHLAQRVDEINKQLSMEDSNILTFQRHDGGLVMRAATIKAHIKDCARRLSEYHVGSVKGQYAFSTRVLNTVYPDPATYWIPILRPNGKPITKPDGEQDKPIHVSGPQGRQNALKRFEWVEPWRLDFVLHVLAAPSAKTKKPHPAVQEEDLQTLGEYGGCHGYAGERGDGDGRYAQTIRRIR